MTSSKIFQRLCSLFDCTNKSKWGQSHDHDCQASHILSTKGYGINMGCIAAVSGFAEYLHHDRRIKSIGVCLPEALESFVHWSKTTGVALIWQIIIHAPRPNKAKQTAWSLRGPALIYVMYLPYAVCLSPRLQNRARKFLWNLCGIFEVWKHPCDDPESHRRVFLGTAPSQCLYPFALPRLGPILSFSPHSCIVPHLIPHPPEPTWPG